MSNYIFIYEGYQIKPVKETPTLFVIVTDGKGGKIPDCLTSMYTSRSLAMIDIKKYLAVKPVKEKTNAEVIETSGSK